LILYPWLTGEEIGRRLSAVLGKHELSWALRNLVAVRTGRFPKKGDDVLEALRGTREEAFLLELRSLTEPSQIEHATEIAIKLDDLARSWFREAARAAWLDKK
jgi:hypothetical protein